MMFMPINVNQNNLIIRALFIPIFVEQFILNNLQLKTCYI